MKKRIIFVHGLGVRKDARGIFTDIEKSFLNDESLKGTEFIFIDLNKIEKDNDGKEKLILNPLSVQAEILEKVFKKEVEENISQMENILICHSQGCVVGSIANLEKVSKIVFIAPPTNNDIKRTFERFAKRPGSVMNIEGESFYKRSDGSLTIVPAKYWSDRKEIDYLENYKSLSEKVGTENLKIIVANQDEVVFNEATEFLQTIGDVLFLDGGHDFEGESRVGLLEKIKEII